MAKAWGGHKDLSWKEDPRIREQDFGNFQDPAQMKEQKKLRREFGEFYFRSVVSANSGQGYL